jgi:hypothetical protein
VAENQKWQKEIAVQSEGLFRKMTELLQHRWQQNRIFILKTVSTKTVRRELHKFNNHGIAAIPKPLITESNAQMRKRWCHDHKPWTSDNWKGVIWSDKSSLTLVPASERVYVWKAPKEAYDPKCLFLTVMVWAATSWYSVGPITALHGRITASDYVDILGNQVHSMIQTLFPSNDAVFRDVIVPIDTDGTV